MLNAFTRNYEDNSTEAGFQFTFYCDICSDGFRSSFIESETYKKNQLFRGIGRGASALGSLFGGKISQIGYGADRASDILSERFENRSPEWQKEHEQAFIRARPVTSTYVTTAGTKMRVCARIAHRVRKSMLQGQGPKP